MRNREMFRREPARDAARESPDKGEKGEGRNCRKGKAFPQPAGAKKTPDFPLFAGKIRRLKEIIEIALNLARFLLWGGVIILIRCLAVPGSSRDSLPKTGGKALLFRMGRGTRPSPAFPKRHGIIIVIIYNSRKENARRMPGYNHW
jgi:hypothetical protein